MFSRPQAIFQAPAWRFAIELAGVIAFIAALAGVWYTYAALRLTNVAFQEERNDREEDRINRAWALVAAAKSEGAGNVGLIQALQTLASRKIDLTDVRLPGAHLREIDLGGAKLHLAKLHLANLRRADLRHADLWSADLSDANLLDANLSDANLRRADLGRADLVNSKLNGADLFHADLSGANLRGADLRRADLRRANLIGANLTGTILLGARLFRADLTDAVLSDANLRYATLRGATLCRTVMPDGSDCRRNCNSAGACSWRD